MSVETLRSQSEDETIQIGEQFATRLVKGDVVLLKGDLGAGKTEFAKGICRFLAVDDLITSPTFTIINQYKGSTQAGEEVAIYHVDLYRIENQDQLVEIGFDDMVFAHDAIKLIEWPQNAGVHVPEKRWEVTLEQDSEQDDYREITITRVNGE